MNEQDKDLAAFEEYLFALVKNSKVSKALASDEIAIIFENNGPPEEIKPEEKESLVSLMKRTHEGKKEAERKMKTPASMHSLGELMQMLCTWKTITILGLARYLNLTKDQLEAHFRNEIFPEVLGKERILNLTKLAGFTIQETVAVIDKTMESLTANAPFKAGGYEKAYAEIGTPDHSRVREEGEPGWGKTATSNQPVQNWKALRAELLAEAHEQN